MEGRVSELQRLRVEGAQLGSGQNSLRVLSGQTVLMIVVSGELDPPSIMSVFLQ
jgi:hypothetical protein